MRVIAATDGEHVVIFDAGEFNPATQVLLVVKKRVPEPTPEPVDTRQPWEKDRDDVLAKYPDAKAVQDERPTPYSHGVWHISGVEVTMLQMHSEPRAWVVTANRLFNRDNPIPEIYDAYKPESARDIPLAPVAQIVQKAVDETVPQTVAERTISRLSKFTDALQAGDLSAYRITLFQMDTDGRVSRDLMT